MIRLTAIIDGHEAGELTHESSGHRILLGRDPAADFVLPLSTISRRHARIQEVDGVYTIEDLGSLHGTLVNGRKLGECEKKILRDGDVVEMAEARLTCRIGNGDAVSADAAEGTQTLAARAVQGILGRLGDGGDNGPFVRVLSGAGEGVRLGLGGALTEWTLGRAKDCELVLDDPNVSRRHAAITRDWKGFTIRDLGSKNGVKVNDEQVAGPRRLEEHDEITVGPVTLVFVDPDAELLAALQDVPGFGLSNAAEPEGTEDHAAVRDLPAEGSADTGPGAEPDAAEVRGDERADDHGERPPDALEHGQTAYDGIDPCLLELDKGGRSLERMIVGVIAVVLVISVALLLYVV